MTDEAHNGQPLPRTQCWGRPHHYRQQGQHLPAARPRAVTYLSAVASNNCSAGKGGKMKRSLMAPLWVCHALGQGRGAQRVLLAGCSAGQGAGNHAVCDDHPVFRSAQHHAGDARGAPASSLRSRNLCACSLGWAPSEAAGWLPGGSRILFICCVPGAGQALVPAGYPHVPPGAGWAGPLCSSAWLWQVLYTNQAVPQSSYRQIPRDPWLIYVSPLRGEYINCTV